MPNNGGKTQIIYPLLLICVVLILSLLFVASSKQPKLPWFKAKEAETKPVTTLPPKAAAKAKIPVLVYHYVEIVTDKRDFIRASLAISPQNFERQVISLKKSGYTFYFVKDIGSILDNGPVTKPVILTFDDGYGDFYTDAFPILKRQNVKATAFINSGLTGHLNYMTREQVTTIANSGLVEIGGHGFSHQNLVSISLESAKRVVNDDVSNIKKLYGITPVSFAYPYGSYNNNVKEAVGNAGYKYAVTLEKNWVVQDNALLEIPRLHPGLAGNGSLGDFLDSLK